MTQNTVWANSNKKGPEPCHCICGLDGPQQTQMQSLPDHQSRGAVRCSDGNSLKVTQKEAGQGWPEALKLPPMTLAGVRGQELSLAQHSLGCEPLTVGCLFTGKVKACYLVYVTNCLWCH